MKRREQVLRYCQCASTSRQKTHQANADRAPRFRQCLIIAPRSSAFRVELHWRLGPGACIAEARHREVQSQAQGYVFNVLGWLAETARSWYLSLRRVMAGPVLT